MAADVWVIAEHHDGRLKKVTLEGLGLGKQLAAGFGGSLAAVLVGGSDDMIAALGRHGARQVYRIQGIGTYTSESYAGAVAKLLKDKGMGVVILGATAVGRDLGPRLAAKLEAGLAADCTAAEAVDGKLLVTRPVYAGKAVVTCTFNSDARIMSIRPNVLPPAGEDPSGTAEAEDVAAPEDSYALRKKVLEVITAVSTRPELAEADIVVSGGRGLKEPANFKIIEELADALGAAVGASRAAVDAGWRDHRDQVGQTGRVVSPALYIACGISGAIQHLAGMKTSKVIVAINKDPEAPIFNLADYGIVGDLFEVVPMMTEEVKKLKAQG